MKQEKIEWVAAAYVFLLPFLLYVGVFEIAPRSLVEAVSIVISLIIILSNARYRKWLAPFVGFVFLMRSVLTDSFVVGAYDLAGISILLYYTRFCFSKKLINFLIFSLVVIELIAGIYSYVVGDFIDYYRIGGLFPSSMHYGFATAGLAFASYFSQNGRMRIFISACLLASALLSGSRAALLCVVSIILLTIISDFGKKSAIVFACLVSIFLLYFSDFRALGYVEESDTTRLGGYLEWFDRMGLEELLLGKGRYFTGSVGVHASGEDALVVESSFLSFIEAYGVLLSPVFLLAPIIKMIKLDLNLLDYFAVFVFFVVSFLSPFFETPSILFMNTILISSAIHVRRRSEISNNFRSVCIDGVLR